MNADDDDENHHNEVEEERSPAVSVVAGVATRTSQPSATKKTKNGSVERPRAGTGSDRISESSTLAFDYFNDPSLFQDDDDENNEYGTHFYNRFTSDRNQQLFQNRTIGEFFAVVHEKMEKEGKNAFAVLESYYLRNKALFKAVADYDQWMEEIAENRRLTSADFGITTHALAHNFDLKLFEEQINDVFNWYKVDQRSRSSKDATYKKVGPYLCFVQSSGMGKTKLMYEYRMKSFQEDSKVASCLILPADIRYPSHETDVYDFRPDFRNDLRYCTRTGSATRIIYSKLDEILQETLEKNMIRRKANWSKNHGNETSATRTLDDIEECDKIVLMFDESQLLVEEQYKFDAFLFRCVRIWLREKRKMMTTT
jgi:hypothetical protein